MTVIKPLKPGMATQAEAALGLEGVEQPEIFFGLAFRGRKLEGVAPFGEIHFDLAIVDQLCRAVLESQLHRLDIGSAKIQSQKIRFVEFKHRGSVSSRT